MLVTKNPSDRRKMVAIFLLGFKFRSQRSQVGMMRTSMSVRMVKAAVAMKN